MKPRRGDYVATVNARWNNETSVLFGDYLFTHAFHLASSLDTTLACRLIGRATNIVCEGELTQTRERGNLDLSEEASSGRHRRQNGRALHRLLLSRRHYADADETVAKSLEQYRRPHAGDRVSDFRRPLGHPGLRRSDGQIARHRFFQEAEADAALDPPARPNGRAGSQRLRELLTQADDDAWGEVVRWLHRSDAVEYAGHRALEFAAAARSHLECLRDSSAKQMLVEITEFATQRATNSSPLPFRWELGRRVRRN